MSLEAWGDDGDADRPYTQERVDEIVSEAVAPFLELLKEIVNSDMAQREEDEGNISSLLEKARALIATN